VRALRFTVLALIVAGPAGAHLMNTGLGPFYDGVSHFALTPEDLIPALALALLAGLRGAGAGRRSLFVLPAAWLAGGFLGFTAPGAQGPAALTAGSFLLLGILVAADARLPAWAVLLLGSLLGLTHGYLNGAAMAEARLGLLGLTGIVCALFALVALVAALVVSLRAVWTRIAVRVLGSWIAAAGLLLLGWSLRLGRVG
jgi:hydrogenase/urease accessory protein HupE